MFRLDGKVALVTGGSRGIGAAICSTLAAQGAHVVVNYARGEEQAKQVCERIKAAGGSAQPLQFDVGDSKSIDAAIPALVKERGRLDIVVSNAGITVDQLVLRVKDEDMDKVLSVNIKGAIALSRACMMPMMKARGGRIVFLSSVVGEMGNAGQAVYASTKAALLGLTKTLAREYASRNITVNAIAPGFIETDMTAVMNEKQREGLLASTPVGRLGKGEDIANATLYLVSDEASFVTGQVLRVNGGLYM